MTSPAIPLTGFEWIATARIDAAKPSSSEREALALSDELIAEVEAANDILIGAALHNGNIPAPLKVWIDRIRRCPARRDVFRSRSRQKHEHKVVGRVSVNWDDCSFRQSRAVDRAMRHGLGRRQEFDTRQEIDCHPGRVLW